MLQGLLTECRGFRATQSLLDTALREHHRPPCLNPAFRTRLRRQIRKERRDTLWSAAPDLLHVGGGLVVTAACAIVLPWPAHTILAAGTALTAATYALYTVALSWMEQAE